MLACVFGPVNIVLALLIWWRMGFLLFNTIGSNEELNSEAPYDLHEGAIIQSHAQTAQGSDTQTTQGRDFMPCREALSLGISNSGHYLCVKTVFTA